MGIHLEDIEGPRRGAKQSPGRMTLGSPNSILWHGALGPKTKGGKFLLGCRTKKQLWVLRQVSSDKHCRKMLAIVVLRVIFAEQIWLVEPELGKRLYLFPPGPAQAARPEVVEAVVGAFIVQRNSFTLKANFA